MLVRLPKPTSISLNMLIVTALLAVFSMLAYHYVIKLNALGFYELMNIAFDFDQAVFMKAIDGSYLEAITAVESIWIKHPFVYLYSYISFVLQYLGFSKFDSIAIICLFSISLSLFLMWKTFMLITKDSVLSFLLLCLLATTSSVSSIAIVFDSYTILSTWIALAIFLLAKEYYQNKRTHSLVLAFTYVMLTGVTVYMVLLIIFIESFKTINNIKNQSVSFRAECQRLLILILMCLLLGIVMMIMTYPEQFFLLLESPLDYLKQVLWAVVRPGERASIFEVFYILSANGLVAPTPTLIAIPDGFLMFDLRSLHYTILQFGSLFLLYLAFVAGIFNKKHFVTLPCFIFILISFIFHIEYHDRGSLFLYSSHLIFPIFVCIAAGLASMNTNTTKVVMLAVIAISCWSSIDMLSGLNTYIETFKSETQ